MLAINKDGTYQLQAGHHEGHGASRTRSISSRSTKQQAKKIIERSHARHSAIAGASTELDLRGMTADEAIAALSISSSTAPMHGQSLPPVRIIHGKGTGASCARPCRTS